MAQSTDAAQISSDGRERKKRRMTSADWDHVAEFICDEHSRRKNKRKDLEKQWVEIDRQCDMIPDVSFKKDGHGKPDHRKLWMSEMELPLQAQALEVLTADARELMFPGNGNWFKASAGTSDEYLANLEATSIIYGDENDVPWQSSQDAADKLVEGYIQHIHRQYDFPGHIDQINAEAFKYGVGLARVREVSKRVFANTARGVVPMTQNIPILVPRSIRKTYLDDTPHYLMNEGQIIGPGYITEETRRFEDLVLSANRGNKEPTSPNGGWMPKNIGNLVPGDHGMVRLLEYEGDIVVPRKTTDSLYIPGVIVTIAIGGKDGEKQTRTVVRARRKPNSLPTFLEFPYHHEGVSSAYATSPLMKGRTVAASATQALNRLLDSAALRNAPPMRYDKDDASFAATGGPAIEPYGKWPTLGPVNAIEIGDPTAMLQMYLSLLQQYADLTGVSAPRLGRQTVSHTTAYAKNAELQRGSIRTVDYVKSIGEGPMTRFLYMEYEMARNNMRDMAFYIPSYRGWVEIGKEALPEKVHFQWEGASGPGNEQAEQQAKIQSANTVLQIEQLDAQLKAAGYQPNINLTALKREVLGIGGWTDIDMIMDAEADAGAGPPPAGVSNQLPGILTMGANG